MEDLTLVIPAKNESECLSRVLSELKNFDCKKVIIIPKNEHLGTRLSRQNMLDNSLHRKVTQHVSLINRRCRRSCLTLLRGYCFFLIKCRVTPVTFKWAVLWLWWSVEAGSGKPGFSSGVGLVNGPQ